MDFEKPKLAANEARPVMRVLAFGLALISWLVVLSLAYETYRYAVAPVEGWSFLFGALVMAIWSSYVALRGFVPPWVLRLLPFLGAATNGRRIRRR
ncbi:hypothetical protein S4A8_09430 [Salinisphaera sp. S4-8]